MEFCDVNDNIDRTQKEKEIVINEIKYKVSINKSNNQNDSLIIKIYEPSDKSDIYFTYEASLQKLMNDVKFLRMFDTLDEMLNSLNNIFYLGNAKVEKNQDNYFLELKCIINGITKKSTVRLNAIKLRQQKNEIEDKLEKLENKYNELINKYNELKQEKEDNIKNIVNQTIFNIDTKMKLFEEMEQLFLSKYNLNNIQQDKNEIVKEEEKCIKQLNKDNININNKIEKDIIAEIKNEIKNKEEKINKEIVKIQEQIKDNIDYLDNVRNNYIILQVVVDKNHINKPIILLNQVIAYKHLCNFEWDDIEIMIDDQIVPFQFKVYNSVSKRNGLFCHEDFDLYQFFLNFSQQGIYTIKIIFKKKLLRCNSLFEGCDNISAIDCSNFDCSQIIDCSQMFCKCSSLVEINLGKLKFNLSKKFKGMFYYCINLKKLDISYLDTNNSESFEGMFSGCYLLKEIDVSKFKTKYCKNIECMFYKCYNLESIDMLNWDMKNISEIDGLFCGCSNLKIIKMNFNNNNSNIFYGIDSKTGKYYEKTLKVFYKLPNEGTFISKKGMDDCSLFKYLPFGWQKLKV